MKPALILSWVLAGCVLAGALFVGATADSGPSTTQEHVYEIASTVRCPQCRGQAVAESDVAIARTIRADIAAGLEKGLTDDEIRDRLTDSYGTDISLVPPSTGASGVIWWLPALLGAGALAGLIVIFARWSKRSGRTPSEADQRLVDEALARHGTGSTDGDRP